MFNENYVRRYLFHLFYVCFLPWLFKRWQILVLNIILFPLCTFWGLRQIWPTLSNLKQNFTTRVTCDIRENFLRIFLHAIEQYLPPRAERTEVSRGNERQMRDAKIRFITRQRKGKRERGRKGTKSSREVSTVCLFPAPWKNK